MKRFSISGKLVTRRIFLIIVDIITVSLTAYIPLIIRYDFNYKTITPFFVQSVWNFLPFTIVFTVLIYYIFRLYHSLWSFAGITEMQNVITACVINTFFQGIGINIIGGSVPKSYYFIYLLVLTAATLATRFSYRFARSVRQKHLNLKNGTSVMIIGAGEAANVIIKEIMSSNYSQMVIKCIIDDNPAKKGRYIQGIKVVGDRKQIVEFANLFAIDEIIIAIPSAPKSVIRDMIQICQETKCKLRTLPGMYQLVNGEVDVSKLRDVDVEDLLGRDPIKVDMKSIVGYVQDKTVLVTGGGGSIGSELCRQVAAHGAKKLIIVDFYENNAYEIQQELLLKYPDLVLKVLIASVRNTNRMMSIFMEHKPDIVYHAAAHKHVPLMEESPNEAVKNNVFGTWKTAAAASVSGVGKFVMISTDKAVNPTNIMGASKRICEMIVQYYSRHSKTEFVAVRFGNVLGSNGSVIPLFRRQIEAGGPVTVTHPDIIRYFMTIPEAVSLVLQAGAYAKGGEIFILEMGEPVKILDLAKNLIRLSGFIPNEDIKIEFTGLRPGEKLYEELLMEEEGLQDTENQLIHIGKPIEFDEEKFLQQLEELNEAVKEETLSVREKIKEIVPTYTSNQE